MKILHTVEEYSPSVGGMQEAVRQISEELARLGHEVTVATKSDPRRTAKALNGVAIEEFNLGGNAVAGYAGSREEQERYQNFLIHGDFDVVANFAAQQWATDLALPVLNKIKAKKVFIPTGFSKLYDPAYAGYFEGMQDRMREYDLSIFLSSNYRDIDFARQHGIASWAVIPNGASRNEFESAQDIDMRKKLGIGQQEIFILLVGSHTGMKGHREAMQIFLQASLKRPATLLIVGNTIPSSKRGMLCYSRCRAQEFFSSFRRGKRILVRQLSRKETVAAYKAADLFLFPSNIECSPIVLFEAMAAKLPFLVTDVGNSREITEWSHGGLLLPTRIDAQGRSRARVRESARVLADILQDAPLRERLAQNGHEAWKERFTWEAVAKRYEEEYEKLVKQH